MADYEWQCIWQDSQRDEKGEFCGHSIYRDRLTGKESIKDMSGDLPHQTDDGVLWVDRSRPVVFDVDRLALKLQNIHLGRQLRIRNFGRCGQRR